MMPRLLGTILFAWTMLAAAAQAQQPVVVELYTSQGCSSCPPADALLAELADRDDVIALALHVDYWDYIGWKDEMARPEHTARQKGYAVAAGKRMVYTPQMVIGGSDHVTGYKPMEVADLIRKHQAVESPVKLLVRRDGERLEIEATAREPLGKPVAVQVVRFLPERTVSIKRGENAGKTIDYHNIVDLWAEIGRWNGRGTYTATARVAGDEPLAVILQEAGHGPVVAAARVR
jgi:hypothetical protein